MLLQATKLSHMLLICASLLARCACLKMLSLMLFALPAMGAAAVYPQSTATNMTLLTDINQISRYWGQITPYADNAEDHFGVQSTGLPEGCQVEQAHVLQRHAQRFPTSGDLDGKLVSSTIYANLTES